MFVSLSWANVCRKKEILDTSLPSLVHIAAGFRKMVKDWCVYAVNTRIQGSLNYTTYSCAGWNKPNSG